MRPDFCGAEKGGVVQLSRMHRRRWASGAQAQGGERKLKRGKLGAGREVSGSKLVVVGGRSGSEGEIGVLRGMLGLALMGGG